MFVYQYVMDNRGVYPDDSTIKTGLKFSHQSGVANLKRELKSKGYLSKRHRSVVFTDEAWSFCQELSEIVSPLRVKLLGNVRAGKLYENIDDAIIEDWSLQSRDMETLIFPSQDDIADVFGLQVIGKSMEHEDILEGDYVIVQRFKDGEGPSIGQLIITYYVPLEDANVIFDTYETESLFIGPVIKYFYETHNPGKEKSYYLGWRTDKSETPDRYGIRAAHIRPVGKVIGIYRQI